MEYTKGEWKVAVSKVTSGEFYSVVSDYRQRQIELVEISPTSQANANAHLIAKAPRMYETLKAVWAERVNIGIDKPFWTPHNTKMLQQIIAEVEEV